jgi:hypothetical protein
VPASGWNAAALAVASGAALRLTDIFLPRGGAASALSATGAGASASAQASAAAAPSSLSFSLNLGFSSFTPIPLDTLLLSTDLLLCMHESALLPQRVASLRAQLAEAAAAAGAAPGAVGASAAASDASARKRPRVEGHVDKGAAAATGSPFVDAASAAAAAAPMIDALQCEVAEFGTAVQAVLQGLHALAAALQTREGQADGRRQADTWRGAAAGSHALRRRVLGLVQRQVLPPLLAVASQLAQCSAQLAGAAPAWASC